MFSSEPIFSLANRFEPTDQSALSNRAYLSGRRGAEIFHPRHPGQTHCSHKTRDLSSVSVARDVAWCTRQRTISPHRSPPRDHHSLGVVRDRRPVVFLREKAAEAIHDPSWSRDGREESEGHRAQAACHGHGARVALVARLGVRRRLRGGRGLCRSGGRARPCPRARRGTHFRATQSGQPSSIGSHRSIGSLVGDRRRTV